ncbi:MAG TPA: class D sortase [Candidatus Polarisedimenticolia bacterium]|nr:class D sortase [Candidatus Polarisedimenticolia bacterium]
MRLTRARRLILGGVCVAVGAAILADAAFLRHRERAWQKENADRFAVAAPPAAPPAAGPGGPSSAPRPPRPRRGAAVARLRIDRLGLDVVVAEGTDPKTLRRGPGHMEGSARPGEPDNCIIAGHRDGPFARLGSIKPGDVVDLTDDAGGLSRYRVERVSVVDKEDARSLEPSREPLLTLVTCFPIHYVGPAPRRLVVRGRLNAPRGAFPDRLSPNPPS